jgi:phosphoglycolate phosphatase
MASLRRVKAFIFDFDGTLAVLNIDFSYMTQQVFELMKQFNVDGNTVKERYLLEIIDEVFENLARDGTARADAFYERAHLILHEIEMDAAGRGKLIPGTEEALKDLRTKGIKIGIVTRNCEDAVRKVFPSIEDYCDIFVSRNSVKKVKPHPDHLRYVMKALRIGEEEAVMVGDHTIDIQAGKRAGMTAIGVLTGRTKREDFEKAGADYILPQASDVRALLEGGRDGKESDSDG